MARTLLASILGALLAAACFWVLDRSQSPAGSRGASQVTDPTTERRARSARPPAAGCDGSAREAILAAVLRDLERRLARLESRPADDEARIASQARPEREQAEGLEETGDRGAVLPGDGADDGEPVTSPTAPPTDAERVRAIGRAYDATLEEEDPDPGWSRPTEDSLSRCLQANEIGSPDVEEVRCGRTLCRLRLKFRALDDRERFFYGLAQSPAGRRMGEMFLLSEEWEDTDVEVYLAREGESLPALLGWQ